MEREPLVLGRMSRSDRRETEIVENLKYCYFQIWIVQYVCVS
jgi:hypothetical protein